MRYRVTHVWIDSLKTKDCSESFYITDYATDIEVDSLEQFKSDIKKCYGQNVIVCMEHTEMIPEIEFNEKVKSEMKIKQPKAKQQYGKTT